MPKAKRPFAYWFLVVFLALSIILMLAGQTVGVFDYQLAESVGLQEKAAEMGPFGVEVNRAFGAGDTAVYIPLMAIALVGLLRGKRWALVITAAVAGISAYWTATVTFLFAFLPGVPGYSNVPGPEIWLFIATYFVFGIWALVYLVLKGDTLLR